MDKKLEQYIGKKVQEAMKMSKMKFMDPDKFDGNDEYSMEKAAAMGNGPTAVMKKAVADRESKWSSKKCLSCGKPLTDPGVCSGCHYPAQFCKCNKKNESVKIKKSELKEYIDKQVNKLLEGYTHNSWSVLPIGNQNLESGDNKYFNIFDNWGNSQFTLVLVKRDGKYYGIWGSGDGGYAKAGEDKELEHDQTQKRMGRVQVVQEFIFKPKQLKEIAKQVIQKIGSKNLSSAVFK